MCYIGMITTRSSTYMQYYTLQHTAFSMYIKKKLEKLSLKNNIWMGIERFDSIVFLFAPY